MKLLSFIFILVLSGCTTYYTHPTKAGSQFAYDKAMCIRENTRNICQNYGPSSQTHCSKNALTGGVDCFSNSSPGGVSCKNETDNNMVKNCLVINGWRDASKTSSTETIQKQSVNTGSNSSYSNCVIEARASKMDFNLAYSNCMNR